MVKVRLENLPERTYPLFHSGNFESSTRERERVLVYCLDKILKPYIPADCI